MFMQFEHGWISEQARVCRPPGESLAFSYRMSPEDTLQDSPPPRWNIKKGDYNYKRLKQLQGDEQQLQTHTKRSQRDRKRQNNNKCTEMNDMNKMENDHRQIK